MDLEGRVLAIEAFIISGLGQPETAFTLSTMSKDGPGSIVLTSSSAVIQGALLRAFITGADVKIETERQTSIIHRVNAFEPGSGAPGLANDGEYRMSRLATQRTADGDHLEVFLIKIADNTEEQFNVFEPTFQPLFLMVFEAKTPVTSYIPVQITYDGKTVTSVRIGEK